MNGSPNDDLPSDGEIVIFREELSDETRYLAEIEKVHHVSIEIEETVTETSTEVGITTVFPASG